MSNTILRLFERTVTENIVITEIPYKRLSEVSPYKELYSLMHEVVGYTGPAIRVIRSDSAELDINFKDDGFLDTDALLTFAGALTVHVMTIYGQMGFSDATAGVGRRPVIVLLGVLNTNKHGQVSMYMNDCLFTATMPYASTDTPVTTSIIYETVSGNAVSGRVIASDNTTDLGIEMIALSPDYMHVNTNTASGNYTTSNNTEAIEGENILSTFVHIKGGTSELFQNGASIDTSAAINANLDTGSANFAIGDRGTTIALPFEGEIQFIGIQLTDEKSNQTEVFDLTNPRYQIDGLTPYVPDTTSTTTYDSVDTDGTYFAEYPTALPNDEYASGRIVGSINYSEFINFFAWQNLPKSQLGSIDLVNIDSQLNSLVTSDNNYLELSELDNDTLTVFATSEIKNIGYIENGRIRIEPKHAREKLNQSLPTDLFTATYPNLENDRKLMALGECYLIAPRILDASTNTYFVSDDIYNIVTVYDRGISVAFTQTTNGFILTANPNGRVLCDVEGLSDGVSSYEKHISEHVPRLLYKTGIVFNDTDLTTIHPTIDSSWSGTNENVSVGINQLLNGFNSYYYFQSDGVMRFGKLQNPVSPTGTLKEIEIIGEIKAFKDTASVLSERLLNNRNYNQYSDSEIVYTALEADKINFVKGYQVTTTGTGLHEFYQGNNIDMVSQSLGGQVSGQVILDERIALWSSLRFFYQISTTKVFNMNEVITVTDRLKGLENGKDLLIVGRSIDKMTNKINYWAWG